MRTIILLTISNIFMTFAWYWHLKQPQLRGAPLWITILACWGIALLEYCFQVPANRLGAQGGWLPSQLKIVQELITLVVFAGFAWWVLKQPLAWNDYVGFGLVLAGVFVVFNFRPASRAVSEPAHAAVVAKVVDARG